MNNTILQVWVLQVFFSFLQILLFDYVKIFVEKGVTSYQMKPRSFYGKKVTGKQGFQNVKVIIVSNTTIMGIHTILFLQETTLQRFI